MFAASRQWRVKPLMPGNPLTLRRIIKNSNAMGPVNQFMAQFITKVAIL